MYKACLIIFRNNISSLIQYVAKRCLNILWGVLLLCHTVSCKTVKYERVSALCKQRDVKLPYRSTRCVIFLLLYTCKVEPIEMYQQLVTNIATRCLHTLLQHYPPIYKAHAAILIILYCWYLQDLHTSISVLPEWNLQSCHQKRCTLHYIHNKFTLLHPSTFPRNKLSNLQIKIA